MVPFIRYSADAILEMDSNVLCVIDNLNNFVFVGLRIFHIWFVTMVHKCCVGGSVVVENLD